MGFKFIGISSILYLSHEIITQAMRIHAGRYIESSAQLFILKRKIALLCNGLTISVIFICEK